jgi:hypothetical protein
LADHYGELAHHYRRSGNTQKAVEYLHLAGQQAVQRSAYGEAMGLLTTAMELLKTLPDTPERARQELTLQITLALALAVTTGYAAPAVERAYRRASTLPAARGHCAALPGAAGAVELLPATGRTADGPGARGPTPHSSPTRPRPRPRPGSSLGIGSHLLLAWGLAPSPNAPRAGHRPL